MKTAGILLGLTLCAALARPQEPVAKTDPRPCDLIRTENRLYCWTCPMFAPEGEIDRSVHTRCRTKVEAVPACVKVSYPCKMHGDGWVQHSRRCCPVNVKDCCIETTTLARVEYRCDTCLHRGKSESDVIHVNTRCPGPVTRTCEKSSFFPHGGEAYPAFGQPKTSEPAPARNESK